MKPKTIILGSLLFLFAGSVMADTFEVAVDHAKVLRLPRAAAAVIVGNPAVADAAVHNGSMLFITGKTFGVTNFIALDSEGRTIVDRDLRVLPSDNRLTLHLGGSQRSYLCGEGCEPVPGIGDDGATFDRLMDQHKEKADEGATAAED
ncbi:hypothetical protein MNBD_ALPHA06-1561 [hydrothermal vent metagenome]|uniref:Pilus formation protein N-terminal domain-containing protein n=1 Tax=hydrothermal vent metagenome TaxID=652676 RepID=A0A3B0RLB0_9ZZZZ